MALVPVFTWHPFLKMPYSLIIVSFLSSIKGGQWTDIILYYQNNSRLLLLFSCSHFAPFPKITKDLYRVICFRVKENCPLTWEPQKVVSYLTNGVYETKILDDIALGNIFIVDFSHVSLGHLTRITPTLITRIKSITEKIYNDRQKACHLIYNGPGADIVMTMLKSTMREKVKERVR